MSKRSAKTNLDEKRSPEIGRMSFPLKKKAVKRQIAVPVSGLPSDFQLTKEFEDSFELMEHSSKNLFITGRAGTGKSTLLHYFKEQTKKNIVVVAPTGVAAINIGGSTIHSVFQLPTRLVNEDDVKEIAGKRRLFNSLDTVVVDEVSMVRVDIMEAIDGSLRINRGQPDLPFGGVQMIFIGDLYQLPPVVEPELRNYFTYTYGSPFFFNAKVFSEISLTRINLERIFRQHDEEFITLLNNIRDNVITHDELNVLNQRYSSKAEFVPADLAITLTSTNQLAFTINQQRLNALPLPEYGYHASKSGMFSRSVFPSEELLTLRNGAQVMMVRNDPAKRWVNGSLGVIEHLTEEEIFVRIGDEVYNVEKAIWEEIEYAYNAEERKIEPRVIGTFLQYPIKLAWAITIHKSQGKTFDNVIIDFGTGAFAHGQAYVALSRCRTLAGIQLTTRIKRTDIQLDSRVREFMRE